MAKNKNNQSVWSSRFKKKKSSFFDKIGSSINVDKRLYKEDINCSLVHVDMLFKQKIPKFGRFNWEYRIFFEFLGTF